MGGDFTKNMAKRNKFPGGCAEGNVLSFSCAEGDLGLELAAPLDGTAVVDYDIAGAREDTVAEMGELLVPGARKIGIDEHVESARGVRVVDEAFVFGVGKIRAEAFNSLFVKLGGFGGESGTVVHSHADVWPGHLC